LSVDIQDYLKNIPETAWKRGNSSESIIESSYPYFFKRIAGAPHKVHNFIVNSLNSKLGSISPQFEDYRLFSETEIHQLGYTKSDSINHRHIYVFQKIDLGYYKDYFKDPSEYMPILYDLSTFFNVLDKEGIVFHDAGWENIRFNKSTKKLCIIDMDSMLNSTDAYASLEPRGGKDLHCSFIKFEEKYGLNDIKYLNVCIYHNIFFALALGVSQRDDKFILIPDNNVIKDLIAKYISGTYTDTLDDGNKLDKDCVAILTQVTYIISSYIAGIYNGTPYAELNYLAKELAREETEKRDRKEAEKKAREVAKKLAEKLAEKLARELAEKKAREVAKKLAEKLAEKLARELAEKKAREVAKKLAKEEAEKLAREREEAEKKLRIRKLVSNVISCLVIFAIFTLIPWNYTWNNNDSQGAQQAVSPVSNDADVELPQTHSSEASAITENTDYTSTEKPQKVSPVSKDTDSAVSYSKANELVIKGDELRGLGRYDEAIQAYDKVIEINSNNADAWNNKGLSLIMLSRYGEAIQALDKAIEIKPNNAAAWSNKGCALDGLGRYDEAMQASDIAIENDPKLTNALIVKGTVLHHLGRDDEALEAYDIAIAIDPKSADAWGNKGNVLGRLGRYDEAIKALDKATEIKPNNSNAWGNYAIAWGNKGVSLIMLGRYDEAIKALDKALEINPNNAWNNKGIANAWRNKGIALRHLSRDDEASVCDKKAAALESK
jgi:tetratricopeptide (TPR) repeat protein